MISPNNPFICILSLDIFYKSVLRQIKIRLQRYDFFCIYANIKKRKTALRSFFLWFEPGHAQKNNPKWSRFSCGANGNLACIIFVIASKLRFNGSYSDELRSPHRLKSAGAPIKVVRSGTRTKKRSQMESFFCGANGNRTSDTRIFSPLLYQLSYGTSRCATIERLPERKTLVLNESGCKSTAFF